MKQASKKTWNQLKAPITTRNFFVMGEYGNNYDYDTIAFHEYEITNDYRAFTSRNAFHHWSHNRDKSGTKCYSSESIKHWERGQTIFKDNVPYMKHKSLWDLYIHIGYDYKTKRFIK